MALNDEETLNGRRRLHQASSGILRLLDHSEEAEECGPPQVDRDDVSAILAVTKEQCEEAGVVVPDGEFNEVLGTFMRLFGNQDCW